MIGVCKHVALEIWKIFRSVTNYSHLFSIGFYGFYGNKKKTKLLKTNPVIKGNRDTQ